MIGSSSFDCFNKCIEKDNHQVDNSSGVEHLPVFYSNSFSSFNSMPMIRKTIPKKKPINPITLVTNAPANSPPAAPAPDVSSAKKITVNSMLEIGSKKQRMEALINNRFHACFEEFDLIEIIKEIR